MSDDKNLIDGIAVIMRDCWDSNDMRLNRQAAELLKRIRFGDSKDALDLYLANIQVNSLELPSSDAFSEIVDRSIALVKNSN
jgi:hypothetical protein